MAYSNKLLDMRSNAVCMVYGMDVINALSDKELGILINDPNFHNDSTLYILREQLSEGYPHGQWMISSNGNGSDVTLTHISMCIKENKGQTLASLAFRMAYEKSVDFAEAAYILNVIARKNLLFYYSEKDCRKIKWMPGDDNSLMESVFRRSKKKQAIIFRALFCLERCSCVSLRTNSRMG